jgi:hypothetical protein
MRALATSYSMDLLSTLWQSPSCPCWAAGVSCSYTLEVIHIHPIFARTAKTKPYFLSPGGMFANLASIAWSNVFKGRDIGTYGASGSSVSQLSVYCTSLMMCPAAIYAVVSFLACVAPKLTFQLYGIIPVPAWLVVTGIFTYDTYSAVFDKVCLLFFCPLIGSFFRPSLTPVLYL